MAKEPLLGVSTTNPDVDLPEGFDLSISPLKTPGGELIQPKKGTIGAFSVFGDTLTATSKLELAALSKDGLYALPGERNLEDGFAWGWICPSDLSYRKRILDLIEELNQSDLVGFHLTDLQFPDINYCYCERCRKNFQKSSKSWYEWRIEIIKEVFDELTSVISLPLSMSLFPDALGLKKRFGVDPILLEREVEFFVVPVYDLAYIHTYLLETVTFDFLETLSRPLFIEICTQDPEVRNILRAILSITKFPVDGIILFDPNFERIPKIKGALITENELRDKIGRIGNKRFRILLEKIENLPL